ncbi:MAG: alpha/beta hydrolase [Chloroflexi bacterium]|nr:alpha/beta hydrolase [Chloroflexota bacterium]
MRYQNSEEMVNGLRTSYIERGEGPLMVMLHGIAATKECWHHAIDRFEGEYRIIAPDLPGHGATDAPFTIYSLHYLSAWLHDFLSGLDARPATLLGNSLGGALALRYAFDYPEQVQRLVLVNPLGLSEHNPWRVATHFVSRFGNAVSFIVTGAHDQAMRYLDDWVVRDPWDENARGALEYMMDQTHAKGLWPMWVGLNTLTSDFTTPAQRHHWLNEASQLRIPTLVVWGEHDRLLPSQDGLAGAKAHLPHAKTHIFHNSAHVPMLEEPAAFNLVLNDFLQEHPLPGNLL